MNEVFAARREKALELMKKKHAGQTRSGGVPVWHHLDRVSRTLERVLAETKEGTAEEREAIALAGLGHDSIEDTDVTKAELLEAFGPRGLELIEGMTNRLGDDHPDQYVAQVRASDEGTRLIKLSDLHDNCTHVVYNLAWLGTKWNAEYFLPIVRPMISAIIETKFTAFPQAAERLKNAVRASYATLLDEHARMEEMENAAKREPA